jgi:hypothetical protein
MRLPLAWAERISRRHRATRALCALSQQVLADSASLQARRDRTMKPMSKREETLFVSVFVLLLLLLLAVEAAAVFWLDTVQRILAR